MKDAQFQSMFKYAEQKQDSITPMAKQNSDEYIAAFRGRVFPRPYAYKTDKIGLQGCVVGA